MTANRSEGQDLTARRTNAEATDAIRLRTALQRKRCRHCGQSGTAWVVTSTQGDVRYLKCRGCGRTDKIVVARLAQGSTVGSDGGDGGTSGREGGPVRRP